mmetsp:Transcript_85288/g.274650  ORF Transcript_85288/g.274650 Transcript_85288/m.274650 type:complete len:286 (-) Transcript_85288:56-913(-)
MLPAERHVTEYKFDRSILQRQAFLDVNLLQFDLFFHPCSKEVLGGFAQLAWVLIEAKPSLHSRARLRAPNEQSAAAAEGIHHDLTRRWACEAAQCPGDVRVQPPMRQRLRPRALCQEGQAAEEVPTVDSAPDRDVCIRLLSDVRPKRRHPLPHCFLDLLALPFVHIAPVPLCLQVPLPGRLSAQPMLPRFNGSCQIERGFRHPTAIVQLGSKQTYVNPLDAFHGSQARHHAGRLQRQRNAQLEVLPVPSGSIRQLERPAHILGGAPHLQALVHLEPHLHGAAALG